MRGGPWGIWFWGWVGGPARVLEIAFVVDEDEETSFARSFVLTLPLVTLAWYWGWLDGPAKVLEMVRVVDEDESCTRYFEFTPPSGEPAR